MTPGDDARKFKLIHLYLLTSKFRKLNLEIQFEMTPGNDDRRFE